jgi:replicative DNA helicase
MSPEPSPAPRPGAVPPQNLEAEESVLGAMMISPLAIAAVREIVDASDFYRESHGKIYRAALALADRGEPVDAITLTSELETRGELEAVGGRVRLHELSLLVPASANAGHYAEIVRDMATYRGLIRSGGEIAQMGWERDDEPHRLVERAMELAFQLAERAAAGKGDGLVEAGPAIRAAYDRTRDLAEKGAAVVGVPSGFPSLDRLTAGFHPANLVVAAGRPSMGKSALALSIINYLILGSDPVPVAMFTMEMSPLEVAQRLQSLAGNVDSQKLRTGMGLDREEWYRLQSATGSLDVAPLWLDSAPVLTVADIRARARRLKVRRPDLALIVVDYLQLMDASRADRSRVQEVSEISRGLKQIAVELGVPVLALSQLSRQVEQRHDKRPMLSDLRESGSIEQDADVVLFLYRDEYYNPETAEEDGTAGIAELNIAKQRNGPTGTIKLSFVKRFARFSELPPPGAGPA